MSPGIFWYHLGSSLGSSGLVWDHLGSPGIIEDLIWDHLGPSEIIWAEILWNHFVWDHFGILLGSSGMISDHLQPSRIILGHLGLGSSEITSPGIIWWYHLGSSLGSSDSIWQHLGASDSIWQHLAPSGLPCRAIRALDAGNRALARK